MNELILDAERLRARDEATLARLAEYLMPRIRHFATLRGVSDLDADDIVSEVLLRLLKDPDRLADIAAKGDLSAFCLAYARNAIIHRAWRDRKLALYDARVDDATIDKLQTPENHHVIQETSRLLEEAMAELDEGSRNLITMHYIQGCTTQEIAEALGITASTVRVRLHRVKQRLRSVLQPGKEGR